MSASLGVRESPHEATPDHRGEAAPLIGVLTAHESVRSELQRIGNLAGIDIAAVTHAQQLEQCVVQIVDDAAPPYVRVQFHPAFAPYFGEEASFFSPFEHAEQLVEIFLAAGSTRRGWIIGVLGAHGGAGATVLAAWMARHLAESEPVAFIDLDPLSSGVEGWLGLERMPGLRWADLGSIDSAVVPGRVNEALPQLGNLRILSADNRGGVPRVEAQGERVISSLSQVNGVCIADLPRHAVFEEDPAHTWLQWCDVVVVVGSASRHGMEQMMRVHALLPSHMRRQYVVRGPRAHLRCAELERVVGESVLAFRQARTLHQDVEHGVRIGDRTRSTPAADAARIAAVCREPSNSESSQ